MAIIPITLFGDAVLRKKAKPILGINDSIKQLVASMFETMYNADGIGLAANQINSLHSIFILDLTPIKDYVQTKPMVFINPEIVERFGEEWTRDEGCLSIPDISVDVVRPWSVKIRYRDLDFIEHEEIFEGLYARAIQHEYDHLQGILITDKAAEEEKKMLKKDLRKIRERKIKFFYPVTEKQLL